MRICILGTGGVGGYLGAKLWKAGNDVMFVARGEHLASMQRNGLKLESPEGNILVNSTFTDSLIGQLPLDLVIVAVKSFDTQTSGELILPVLKDTTMVLSIQNGVENEDTLGKMLGKKHVLAGVAYILSTIGGLGIIHHSGGTTKFKLGELDGTPSERCRELERLFRNAGIDAEQLENIQRVMWEKWIFICGVGGMTAYARQTIGEILADGSLKEMLQNVIHEAGEVARSKKIHDFVGIEERTVAHCLRLPPHGTSSMHYDVTHGKRVEVEALNGAVVRFGKNAGIHTPANEKIYNELKKYS